MTENNTPFPHMHCTEIQSRLSELLDEQLNSVDSLLIEAHLSECADCIDLLENMKRVQGLLSRQAPEVLRNFNKFHDVYKSNNKSNEMNLSFWDSISKQLENDTLSENLAPNYSTSFISAYLDGEISDGEQKELFERDLAHGSFIYERLGDFLELTRLIQAYAFRMEAACQIDFTEIVLTRFSAEKSTDRMSKSGISEIFSEICNEITAEDLSSFLDEEATLAYQVKIQQHIEQCEICRSRILIFRKVKETLCGTAYPDSLNFWNPIEEKLLQEPVEIRYFPTWRRRLRITLPSAIAALFFTVMLSTSMFLSNHSSAYPYEDNLLGLSFKYPVSSSQGYSFVRDEARNTPLKAYFLTNSMPVTVIPTAYDQKEFVELPVPKSAMLSIPSPEEYLNQIHQEDEFEAPDNIVMTQ